MLNKQTDSSEIRMLVRNLLRTLNAMGNRDCYSSSAIKILREARHNYVLQPIHGRDPVREFEYSYNYTKLLIEQGHAEFIPLNDLWNQAKIYVYKNSIKIKVYVQIESFDNDPAPIQEANYAGISNQGSTCYLNSLLQTLFFTNKLRKAIYDIPVPDDAPTSISLELQRIFHHLQQEAGPASTRKLTKALGWGSAGTAMQRDIHEFMGILIDKLNLNMNNVFRELYVGELISNIYCMTVNYRSENEFPFLDIQLNIHNQPHIFESFRQYTQHELLDGANSYYANEFGYQVASKRVAFKSFPKVLNLHLLRFQYNAETSVSEKYNGRCEFSNYIKLDTFLHAPEKTPAEYTLFAVLVHMGSCDAGHYKAFINPKCKGDWVQFNDREVTACTAKEAINNNFGGGNNSTGSAYMLVYIRNSAIADVFQDVTEEDIPAALIDRLELRLGQQRLWHPIPVQRNSQ